MSDTDFHRKIHKAGSSFNPTCWTEIILAGGGNEESLNEFCRQYWHPLYSFARRSGKSAEVSQDLTQGFFQSLFEKDKLSEIKRGKGRFRNFLLILFKRYMINEYTKSQAEKRGGKLQEVDFADVEEWLSEQNLSPEDLYNKSWALTVLDGAMKELETRFAENGEEKRFALMKPHLDSSSAKTYRESAAELGCTENSFKVAVHRLKKEFGKLLRLKIESTVENSADIDEELRFLYEVLKK